MKLIRESRIQVAIEELIEQSANSSCRRYYQKNLFETVHQQDYKLTAFNWKKERLDVLFKNISKNNAKKISIKSPPFYKKHTYIFPQEC